MHDHHYHQEHKCRCQPRRTKLVCKFRGKRESHGVYIHGVLLNTLLRLALHFSLLYGGWVPDYLFFSWTLSLCFILYGFFFVCYACLVQSTATTTTMNSCSEKISLSLCTEEQAKEEKHINCLFSKQEHHRSVQSTLSHLFGGFVAYISTFSSFFLLCCCCLLIIWASSSSPFTMSWDQDPVAGFSGITTEKKFTVSTE